jgi:2-iminoacetate synthase
MSAGSHTEPGGYTGAGKHKLHHTRRGRIVELGASEWANNGSDVRATGQFSVSDERSAQEISEIIRQLGYEPVWKDWDGALTGESTTLTVLKDTAP